MQWEFGSTIVPHLSKLWKVTFFMLCYVILRVRLQEKFEFDQSREWKTLKHFFVRCLSSDEHMITLEHKKGKKPVEIRKEESYNVPHLGLLCPMLLSCTTPLSHSLGHHYTNWPRTAAISCLFNIFATRLFATSFPCALSLHMFVPQTN